jgi:hypothetical protein
MPISHARANAPRRQDVIHLAGDLDDAAIVAILATGASYLEIEEAVKWAGGDSEQLAKAGRTLTPPAQRVYDILVTDPGFVPPGPER